MRSSSMKADDPDCGFAEQCWFVGFMAIATPALVTSTVATTADVVPVTQLVGTGDAFYKAHAATEKGTWSQMKDGRTVAAAVRAYMPPYIEYGAISGIMQAWSGGAYDDATGLFYGTGGGHGNSNFDGIYAYDDETGATALPLKPSVVDELLYVPLRDRSAFLTWNPRTGARGKVLVSGARPSQRENAAYGRLQWYAGRERIVLLDSIDEPLYVFNDVD